jgi:Zn-dependent peptidase ImmA (M78 family)/DNA-binding XRE family transcriptional regulator
MPAQQEGVMSANLVGARIKALREQLNFSQEALAKHFGFKDRQTLSAIENGERRVTAEELIRASELLAAPIETFTDPFLLIGEGRFSWRQAGVADKQLSGYERDAGRLIAAFRTLGAQLGPKPPLLRRALGLSKTSSFEDAIAAAERFAEEFSLGAAPARRLAAVMEEQLGILVLMVDAIQGVSGAACRLPELDAVLINRNGIAGRRHYDLAHELFHILTWDTMPPAHVEDARVISKDRVEQLADNFASALLMPASCLVRFGDWGGLTEEALIAKLNASANELEVTAVALKWRLVAMGLLTRAVARSIDDSSLRNNGRPGASREKPPLFSKPFVELVARALNEGRLSIRRAAGLLDMAVDDLPAMFAAHGVTAEVEI